MSKFVQVGDVQVVNIELIECALFRPAHEEVGAVSGNNSMIPEQCQIVTTSGKGTLFEGAAARLLWGKLSGSSGRDLDVTDLSTGATGRFVPVQAPH